MDFNISVILMMLILFISHVVYNFLRFNPFQYIANMDVDQNDPLILEAEKKAKSTFDQFINEIYLSHKDDSVVKINYINFHEKCEKIWGELRKIENDTYSIYISTPPKVPKEDYDPDINVNKKDIVDWCVEYKDGTLRGGFTNLALFKIYERKKGKMHPKFLKHIELFKSL